MGHFAAQEEQWGWLKTTDRQTAGSHGEKRDLRQLEPLLAGNGGRQQGQQKTLERATKEQRKGRTQRARKRALKRH